MVKSSTKKEDGVPKRGSTGSASACPDRQDDEDEGVSKHSADALGVQWGILKRLTNLRSDPADKRSVVGNLFHSSFGTTQGSFCMEKILWRSD